MSRQNISRHSNTSFVEIIDEHVKFLTVERDDLIRQKEEMII